MCVPLQCLAVRLLWLHVTVWQKICGTSSNGSASLTSRRVARFSPLYMELKLIRFDDNFFTHLPGARCASTSFPAVMPRAGAGKMDGV